MLLNNRYEIQKFLGGGTFGKTFLAWDHRDETYTTGRACVVKRLNYQGNKDTLSTAIRLFEEETAIRLFEEEAEVLAMLGNHPQIPELYDNFTQEGEFYLVLECIEGKPLRQELTDEQDPPRPRCLTEAQTIRLLQEILEVLTVVHHRDIIHRDLKPENIMRRRVDGKLVLIDFGTIKRFTSTVAGTVAVGTQGYMPGEQARGKPRLASDIYAVGMIGLECLTGLHPTSFEEDDATGEINWSAEQLGLSEEFVAVLNQMIAAHFPHRYLNAAEALAALNQLEGVGNKQSRGYDVIYIKSESELIKTRVLPPPPPTIREWLFIWMKKRGLPLAGRGILFLYSHLSLFLQELFIWMKKRGLPLAGRGILFLYSHLSLFLQELFTWMKKRGLPLLGRLMRLSRLFLRELVIYCFRHKSYTSSRIIIIGSTLTLLKLFEPITFLAGLAHYLHSSKRIGNLRGHIGNGDESWLVGMFEEAFLQRCGFEAPSFEFPITFIKSLSLDTRLEFFSPIFKNYVKESIGYSLRMYPGKSYPGEFFEAFNWNSPQDGFWEYLEDLFNANSISVIVHPLWTLRNQDEQYSRFFEDFYRYLDRNLEGMSSYPPLIRNLVDSNLRIAIMFCAFEQPEMYKYKDNIQEFVNQSFPQTKATLRKWEKRWECKVEYFGYSVFGFIGDTLEPNAVKKRYPERDSCHVIKESNDWKPFGLIEPLYWLATGKHY